jgi:pyruvate,water dikinase
VPDGFAVTTEAYAAHLDEGGLRERIDRLLRTIDSDNVDDAENKSAVIRKAIISTAMPAEIEAEIRRAYQAMAGSNDLSVAVRSSATAEDTPDASFAGQQDTYLWVVGEDEIVPKVKACWASLFNARAVAYRARIGLAQIDVQMGVGVQKMIDAAAAGVAMTLDPINGDRSKIVIDSAANRWCPARSHRTISWSRKYCSRSSGEKSPIRIMNWWPTVPGAAPCSVLLKRHAARCRHSAMRR